jgi:tight adherence protein B
MSDQSVFILMIFAVGFLLAQAFVAPLMGSGAGSRRRLRERIRDLAADPQAERHQSLVRQRYLEDLSPLERSLVRLPGMDALRSMIEQAGSSQRPLQIVLSSLGSAAATAVVSGYLIGWGVGAALLALFAGAIPFLLLKRKRTQRLMKLEEQLPDALTVMSRALRAGLPFTEALNLVSQEMQDPTAKEFGIVFTEINYGGDARSALLGLMQRVPSVTVMAMVTSVLIQRDTGGNLSELLDKLSDVLRSRFRFQRTVRTLSAEGRLSGWILALLPFFMVGAITAINPDYIPMMTEDPTGRKLVMVAFGMIVVGILWLRRIVNIDV